MPLCRWYKTLRRDFFGAFFKDTEAEKWQLAADIGEFNGTADVQRFNNELFAATFNGLYKSSDNGNSWEYYKTSSTPEFSLFLDVYNQKLHTGTFGIHST